MTAITLRMRDVMTNLTVRVTIPRAFRLRVWLGSQIFRFGGWVLGAGSVEIVRKGEGE